MQSIILGNDHKNPLGVLQSLGQKGIMSTAVCWGERTGLLEASIYLEDIHFVKNASDTISVLMQLGKDSTNSTNEKIVITPCCDEAAVILDENRAMLSKYYLFEYSSKYSIDELSDKEFQARLAKEAGLDVPENFAIFSLKDIPQKPPIPCILKPLISMSGSKADLRICRSEQELYDNLVEILPHNQGVILQRYIDKKVEYLVESCGLTNGTSISPVIIENRVEHLYPPNVGLSAFHKVMPFEDCELKNMISQLIKNIGYVGLISIEFAKSEVDGKWYFFEFNVRNDGYNPCAAKAGANINYYHLCDLYGELKEMQDVKPTFIISEERHFMALTHRTILVNEWLKQLKMSSGYTWYYKDDKKPFYVMFRKLAKNVIRSRVRRITKGKKNE